jgi:O-antigen/teichoic acid export membrane protein
MKRLFNNTAFTTIDYFVLIVLNLLATPILIKNFGVEGYGAFVFLSIFSIYGALTFFDLGMEGALMNYVARFDADTNHKKLQDTLSISLAYYTILGLLVGTLIYFSGGFITSRLVDDSPVLNRAAVATSLTVISVNIFLQFLTLPFAAILQGLRRFVITKSVNSGITILRYLLIIVAAIYFHRIELAFMIITGLTVINLVVFLYIFMFRMPQFRHMRIRFNFSLLRTLFNYSSILFVSRIIGLICNQVDKVLIWLYLAITSMTVYDVVARPANMLRLTITIINSAVIPEVARLHHLNDLTSIRKLYINLVRYAYLILLPILVLLYVYIGGFVEDYRPGRAFGSDPLCRNFRRPAIFICDAEIPEFQNEWACLLNASYSCCCRPGVCRAFRSAEAITRSICGDHHIDIGNLFVPPLYQLPLPSCR